MSIGRQIDKKVMVHIHSGLLLSYKKRTHLSQPIIQSEVSQKEKQQYSLLIHVNVWQKPPQYCKVISL